MESLFLQSDTAKRKVPYDHVRPLYDRISWDNPLNCLIGARGVGKTTLLLQRLRALDLPARQALYVDLGSIYFQANRFFDTAEAFLRGGGRYLFVDEVHRYGYGTWAEEIKQAYDLYRDELSITFTGSSAIQLLDQRADLSRRALRFSIPGLSLREFLQLKHRITLPTLTLQDLLERHTALTGGQLGGDNFHPLPYFAEYLRQGYYPFTLRENVGFANRLNSVAQLVLASDIPAVQPTGSASYHKLGQLLFAVASSKPFKPNISKLAERMGMSRDTVVEYLRLLERAKLIATLTNEAKSITALAKPDKIFLDNTNLLYALAPQNTELGTVRETFLLNQLSYLTESGEFLPPAIRLPKRGDFVYLHQNDRFVFEVGGANKSARQIEQVPGHYVVADVERSTAPHIVPLWLFGLLY